MRRAQGQCTEVFTFGDVQVDFSKMEVRRQGTLVPFTAQEFKVLKYVIHNPERVISREELHEVWGYQNYPTTRTVDNHILRLRQILV
jgi:DNA-binding response OmpR family regulator